MLIHLTTAGISLIAMTALLASGSIPKAQKTVKNIVLVHGAFADGSGWEGVYKILTKKGYKVSIVSNPLTGFADDVAATKRVIDRQDGPVILVGHSYGGAVITEAGNDPKAAGLVYISAFAPDANETLLQLSVFGSSIKEPAWKAKPSWYVVATEDHELSPDKERFMAKRAGATVTEIKGSHVVFISQPKAVSAVIEAAAQGAIK